jgi:hypothetical protein
MLAALHSQAVVVFCIELHLVACRVLFELAIAWLVRLALYIKAWVGLEPAESVAALFMPHVGYACTSKRYIYACPALALVAGPHRLAAAA